MLIIFDLDDTLIDTSGCVTPFKMKECVKALMHMGVKLPSMAYEELMQLNVGSSKSKDALSSFARSYGATQDQIDRVLDLLTSSLPDDFIVQMTPKAKEILEFYRSLHHLALVTGGHPPFQREKLKKAGVDSSVFSMISIPEDSVKKPSYEMLQEKFSLPPSEIWVCGDRIEMDLKPGFELGFNTIHMRWGRGALMPSQPWIKHSVSCLPELKEIIR